MNLLTAIVLVIMAICILRGYRRVGGLRRYDVFTPDSTDRIKIK